MVIVFVLCPKFSETKSWKILDTSIYGRGIVIANWQSENMKWVKLIFVLFQMCVQDTWAKIKVYLNWTFVENNLLLFAEGKKDIRFLYCNWQDVNILAVEAKENVMKSCMSFIDWFSFQIWCLLCLFWLVMNLKIFK